jgi:pimeloyl-ACP methyl ester carboxylesterase
VSAAHPRRIVLDDGRLLGFDEWGDRSGVPVFSFHGGISSRLDASPLHEACKESGVRLIAPDRPGSGCSDPAPRRTLLDWPRDVAELANALGIDRFGVMGWSLGGQYTAACAYALPHRVVRAAILGGVVPFEVRPSREGIAWFDRWLLTLCRWAPPLAGLALRIGIRVPPLEGMQRIIYREGNDADREAMRRDPSPTWAAETIKEAVRTGTRGVIRDYRIWRDPWGFDLRRIEVEVGIWQGDDDATTPVADAELLADLIPDAKLAVLPGEGHLSLQRNHGAAAVAWLAEPLLAARV